MAKQAILHNEAEYKPRKNAAAKESFATSPTNSCCGGCDPLTAVSTPLPLHLDCCDLHSCRFCAVLCCLLRCDMTSLQATCRTAHIETLSIMYRTVVQKHEPGGQSASPPLLSHSKISILAHCTMAAPKESYT